MSTALALCIAATGAAFGLWQLVQRRRTLRRVNAMLDRAIAGGFAEDRFDESELSAVEGRLARFLRGSAAARKTAESEQAAVKSLIADISHQTRTPLANLVLYASLLSESELDPGQRAQVETISVQAEKLSFLIRELVKASRLEAGIVAPTPGINPVLPLMEDAAAQARGAAGNKRIELTVEGVDGEALFDPRWTGEALFNIVDNAVKYSPEGGSVAVTAQMLDSFCRIDVADSGPGIPESEQAGIFDRFYRGAGTGAVDGLGLGLYLAREILARQGGYIRVRSRVGEGSVFSLYLPR
ncbi:MAG TPA: HAMP domain-containing histidine kinase [Firmicutes bacterium]|nr:HAMP domain-containing histidine kinase [Bacillota bacterium]